MLPFARNTGRFSAFALGAKFTFCDSCRVYILLIAMWVTTRQRFLLRVALLLCGLQWISHSEVFCQASVVENSSSAALANQIVLPFGCKRSVNPATTVTCVGGKSPDAQPFSIPADRAEVKAITRFYTFGTPWTHIPMLTNFTRLETVTIYYNQMISTVPVTSFANLVELRVLKMTSNGVTSIADGTFLGLQRLEALDLSSNKLKVVSPYLVVDNIDLRYLHLENNKLEVLPAKLLHNLPHLLHFDASNNRLTSLPHDLFAKNAHLVRIILRNNLITQLPTSIFYGIDVHSKTGTIDLRENHLTFVPDAIFRDFPTTASHDVWLFGNPLACDCANHWSVQHDMHGRYVTCLQRNGTESPALDRIQPCQCNTHSGDSTNQQSLARIVVPCSTELQSFVTKPTTVSHCSTGLAPQPQRTSPSEDRTLPVTLDDSIRFPKEGLSLVLAFKRHFDPHSVQPGSRQYLLSYGHHDDVIPFALAVSDQILEILIWETGKRDLTRIVAVDNCQESLASEIKAVVVFKPSGTTGEWSVSLHVNGAPCQLSLGTISQPILAEATPSGIVSAGKIAPSSPSVQQYPLTIGGGLLTDNITTSNCFRGEIRRLEIFNVAIDDVEIQEALLAENIEDGTTALSVTSSDSWCAQPIRSFPNSVATSSGCERGDGIGTLICRKLPELSGSASARSHGAYKCSRASDSSISPSSAARQSPSTQCPCRNGGKCNYTLPMADSAGNSSAVQCMCPEEFVGQFCETRLCLNCSLQPCKTGWTGPTCLEDIDECLKSPCENLGTCRNLPGWYLCECIHGYAGSECQDKIDMCSATTCNHGETCRPVLNGSECICTGSNCQLPAESACNATGTKAACPENAVCVGGIRGTGTSPALPTGAVNAVCECKAGFKGIHCQDNINECALGVVPCDLSKTTCINTRGSYECKCKDGMYTETAAENATSKTPGDAPGAAESNVCAPLCFPPCSGGGVCAAPNRCVCPLGQGGETCSVSLCDQPCPEGTSCSGVNNCTAIPAAETTPVTDTVTTTATLITTPLETSLVTTSQKGDFPSGTTTPAGETGVTTTETPSNPTTSPGASTAPPIASAKSDSTPTASSNSPASARLPEATQSPSHSFSSTRGDTNIATTAANNSITAADSSKRRNLILVSGILGGVLFLLFILAVISVYRKRKQDKKREEDYLAAHAAMLGTRNHMGNRRSTTIESFLPHSSSPTSNRANMDSPFSDTTFANSIHSSSLKGSCAGVSTASRIRDNGGALSPRPDSNCLVLVHESYSMKADIIVPGSAPRGKSPVLKDSNKHRLSGPSETFTSFDPDRPYPAVFAEAERQLSASSFPRSVSQHGMLSTSYGIARSPSTTQHSMAWDNMEGLVELCMDGPEYEI